jgi:hypothetical protein
MLAKHMLAKHVSMLAKHMLAKRIATALFRFHACQARGQLSAAHQRVEVQRQDSERIRNK